MKRPWLLWLATKPQLKNEIEIRDSKIEQLQDQLLIANYKYKHRLQLDIYSEGTEIAPKVFIDKAEVKLKTPIPKETKSLIASIFIQAVKCYFLGSKAIKVPQLVFHCTDWNLKKEITLTLEEVEILHQYQ